MSRLVPERVETSARQFVVKMQTENRYRDFELVIEMTNAFGLCFKALAHGISPPFLKITIGIEMRPFVVERMAHFCLLWRVSMARHGEQILQFCTGDQHKSRINAPAIHDVPCAISMPIAPKFCSGGYCKHTHNVSIWSRRYLRPTRPPSWCMQAWSIPLGRRKAPA